MKGVSLGTSTRNLLFHHSPPLRSGTPSSIPDQVTRHLTRHRDPPRHRRHRTKDPTPDRTRNREHPRLRGRRRHLGRLPGPRSRTTEGQVYVESVNENQGRILYVPVCVGPKEDPRGLPLIPRRTLSRPRGPDTLGGPPLHPLRVQSRWRTVEERRTRVRKRRQTKNKGYISPWYTLTVTNQNRMFYR